MFKKSHSYLKVSLGLLKIVDFVIKKTHLDHDQRAVASFKSPTTSQKAPKTLTSNNSTPFTQSRDQEFDLLYHLVKNPQNPHL